MPDDDVNDEQTGEEPSEEGNQNLRQLRQLAKKGEKAEALEAEAAQLRRDLAIARSGIDESTPIGKLFLKGFDGDWSDPDAVKAAAEEAGVPFKDGAKPEGETETPPPEPTGTDERRALAAEANPEDGEEHKHPTVAANEAFKAEMERGRDEDTAMGAWVATKAAAAINGDQRAIYTGPNAV